MSRFNGKVVVPSLVALSLALVGGVYAMGRGSINPFRGNAVEAPADDSTTFARTMYNRCGKLSGDAKIDETSPKEPVQLRLEAEHLAECVRNNTAPRSPGRAPLIPRRPGGTGAGDRRRRPTRR